MTLPSRPAEPGGAPRLGSIAAVTVTAPDLAVVEAAYARYLGYRCIQRGVVSTETAATWDAPLSAGRRYVVLGPESGEPVVIRFVEDAAAAEWRALTTFGWNAIEIVVQDVDALAARLAGSPFRTIGAPKGLSRFPMIRAMQVIGPAGECLYLTEVGPGSGLTLAPALSFVGRVFIVVAGGPDVQALFDAYAGFANTADPPVETPVGVISEANGLPPDTLHPHGLVRLSEGTMIELDGYPSVARPRGGAPGELPPGFAMASFTASGAPSGVFTTLAGRSPGLETPARVMLGAAGERIELVDT